MSEELKKERSLKKAEATQKAPEPELPDLEGARWYDEPREKIFKRLKSDPDYGLTDGDAKVRLGFYGKNKYFKTERMSVGKYLSSMRPEPLTWLFLCVAVLYGVFVSVSAAVFITLAIILGYFVLFITGLRAVRILESASQTALPTVAVIRGGRRVVISQEQVVPGDVFELEVGDLVPADARLIESDGLVTFEYGVTEAMGDVYKDASFASFRNLRPGACKNLVFASTIVKAGRGKAIAYNTGKMTRMSRLCRNKNPSAYNSLETFKKMRAKAMASTLLCIALVFVLGIFTYTGVFSKDDPLYGFLMILSFASSLLSQFYPIIAQIVVARGVFGASESGDSVSSGSIIRHPEKLDELRSVDTLIVPKQALVRSHDTRLFSVFESGELYERGDIESSEGAKRLLRLALVSTGLYGSSRLVTISEAQKDPGVEREAIRRAVQDMGLYDSTLDESFPILEHRDADGECVFDTTLYSSMGQFVAVCRGSSEELLGRCTHYFENGRYVHITENVRRRFETLAKRLMRMSCTVLAVATTTSRYNRIKRIDELHSGMVFEGFVCLEEPVLKDSAKMLKACSDAGIRVILTFKDKSEQNYQFAKAQGFLSTRDEIADLEELYENMGDVLEFSVLENVTPEYMQSTVAYLRKKGHRVGFMGMELDDVPSMKSANVCFTQCETLSKRFVAKGAAVEKKVKGSSSWDALRFACDVVVSRVSEDENGGFNAVVGAVMHAKMIFRSMDRVLCYLLSTAIARLLMLIGTLFTGIPLITALQLILLGVLVDLPAVMVMAFEPCGRAVLKEKATKHELLGTLSEYVMPAITGVAMFLVGILSVIVCKNLSMTGGQLTTVSLLTLILSSWALLLSSSSKDLVFNGEIRFSNMFVAALVMQAAEIALFLLIEPFGRVVGVHRTSWLAAAVLFGAFLASFFIFELLKLAKHIRLQKSEPIAEEVTDDTSDAPSQTDADDVPAHEAYEEDIPADESDSDDAPTDESDTDDANTNEIDEERIEITFGADV